MAEVIVNNEVVEETKKGIGKFVDGVKKHWKYGLVLCACFVAGNFIGYYGVPKLLNPAIDLNDLDVVPEKVIEEIG